MLISLNQDLNNIFKNWKKASKARGQQMEKSMVGSHKGFETMHRNQRDKM